MVSILLLISNSFNLLSKHLGTNPSAPNSTGITVTLVFYRFLSFLERSKYLSPFLLSFIFTRWSAGTAKSTKQQVFFVFVFCFCFLIFFFFVFLLSTKYNLLAGIHLYLKIPENFMRSLRRAFWLTHILFGSMFKIQSLAQFSVDDLSHPVVPLLVLLLC